VTPEHRRRVRLIPRWQPILGDPFSASVAYSMAWRHGHELLL
jgi:hypothetical protein